MQNTTNHSNAVANFCAAGLYMVPIPKVNGQPSKGPRVEGWNKPISSDNQGGYSANAKDFNHCNGFNFGLYHEASQTLALDLDDLELSNKVIYEATSVQLSDWLKDEKRAEIKSPKANRAKLLFKLPKGFEYTGLRQFKRGLDVIFELRSGNCQDVIYGQHPEGGLYEFIGDPAQIPPIPEILLDFLQHWDDWKPCFESVLGVDNSIPEIQTRKPLKDGDLAGQRNPISEFNQTKSVCEILLANNYKALGKDRFIRPGSKSKAPGVMVLRDCVDGLERIFSHGGDVLNDGFAHDAFDCYTLLECAGDTVAALNWNPEITKHNQRLYMQDKAQQQKEKSQQAKEWKQAEMYENNTPTEEPDDEPIDESKLPDGTPLGDSDVEILKELNKKYTHVSLGGKNIILGQKTCPVQGVVATFESPSEFKGQFWHKPYIGIGKQKNQGAAWLQWPGKNYLSNGAGFYPDPKKCPKGVYNFYRGFRVNPIEGDCTLYLDHVFKVICNGDEVSFIYLIGFFAHMVQQPDVKPSVAIVLKSVEGTGKGTMVSPILKMLGSHGIQTNGAYSLAGRFNGSMANKLLAFCDEVDITDKYLSDRIKALISESTVNLERKGLEIEPLPNYCRFIFASNHTRVINAGIRERRYLVLEPSADKAQNADYFEELWAWVNNGGDAKLLHYLLNVDISEFNPYKCPQTKALIAEKLDNLSGINRYFYNEIMLPEPFRGRVRINAHELVEDFIKWSKEDDIKVHIASARSLTGKMMAKLKIDVLGRSDRGQGKYYDLPIRGELVQQFADFLDIPVKELVL